MIYRIKEIHGNLVYIIPDNEDNNENPTIAVLSGKLRLYSRNDYKIPLRNPCCVGDFVKVKEDFTSEKQNPLITEILTRSNILVRASPYEIHLLGSNLNRAVLVASLINPDLNTGFIDRFLIACFTSQILPFIVFSKSDLISMENPEHLEILDQSFYYAKLLKHVFYGNLNSPEDDSFYKILDYFQKKNLYSNINSITEFLKEIEDGTTILTGLSGAGKSTLINLIYGKKVQKTLEISSSTGKGKHTTTTSTLFVLSKNKAIIDIPGLKEWGLSHLTKKEIIESYPEWKSNIGSCKFRNCEHLEDIKGCVIQEELKKGILPEWRKKNLESILFSIDYYERIRPGDYKKPTGRFYNSR